MYVCVCSAVTERDIECAAAQGARRLRDLRQCLGVTAECNRCACAAKCCLDAAIGSANANPRKIPIQSPEVHA